MSMPVCIYRKKRAYCVRVCYPNGGHWPGRDTTYGGRMPSPSQKPQSFCKGGGEMVTYENLFNFTLVIIETITLVVLIYKSNK